MTDDELIAIENKYYNILLNVFSQNLGKIITDINSQKRINALTTNAKTNPIDSKAENTIENIIANQLHWDVCSLPVSSDSCYSCGDAIIHIDVKTTLDTDDDNRLNIEAAQTSYVEGRVLAVQSPWSGRGKRPQPRNWTPNLKMYEQHTDFGQVPNLTYFVRIIYSTTNLVEKISLVSVPNGQLHTIFGNTILNGGKNPKKNNPQEWQDIRVLPAVISGFLNQEWRDTVLYTRR